MIDENYGNYVLSQPGYIPPAFHRLLRNAHGDDVHELSVPIWSWGDVALVYHLVST